MVRSKDPLVNFINSLSVSLPCPSNISSLWNFGSLLVVCLMIQILTGILLSIHYVSSVMDSFSSVVHLMRDVNCGWLFRSLHANGASMFFVCLYVHMGRGLYYGSYRFFHTWEVGVTIMLLLMAIAFLGYVLPWGQMSFWGASVITNLLSTIPYIGSKLVVWLWGGLAVGGPTLTRFFSFHFLLPFILFGLVFVHIVYLHETGSNNPLGVDSGFMKCSFHPFFTFKDIVGIFLMIFFLFILSFLDPYLLGDVENFNFANPLSTPPHIQPEWYYLFAYAILRSIPNKFGGVIALVFSVFIFYLIPFIWVSMFCSLSFYGLSRMMFWGFVSVVFLLTWIGACPVEDPYIIIGQVLTLGYFLYFMINFMINWYYDKVNFGL